MVMLVQKAKDYKNVKKGIKFPCMVQIKYDGVFTYIIVEEGKEPLFLTSGGKEFRLNDSPFHNTEPGVYMAEMIAGKGKLGDRQKVQGLQTTMRINSSKGIINPGYYEWETFDYVSIEDFYAKHTDDIYADRLSKLYYSAVGAYVVPAEIIYSRKMLDIHMSKVVKAGWEGLVIKQPDMLWEATTSRRDSFIKWKKIPTFDLRVVEELPGTGKYEGMIGSLLLKDGGGKIVGKVGSGLNDNDRSRNGSFIDRVVEVAAERVSPDGKLVQPRFISLREEKTLDVL